MCLFGTNWYYMVLFGMVWYFLVKVHISSNAPYMLTLRRNQIMAQGGNFSYFFIGPRYTWGLIYGSECLKLREVFETIQVIQVMQVLLDVGEL